MSMFTTLCVFLAQQAWSQQLTVSNPIKAGGPSESQLVSEGWHSDILDTAAPGPVQETTPELMTIHLRTHVLKKLSVEQFSLIEDVMGPLTVTSDSANGWTKPQNSDVVTVKIRSDSFSKLDADQLHIVFDVIGPVEGVHMIQRQIAKYPEYECVIKLWERVNGAWTKTPAHILVKYRDKPKQIYARWLNDGRHAGQEVLYDETKSMKKMYGHLGGVLGLVSLQTSVDGFFAKQQSKHTVKDLGMQFIGDLMLSDATHFERDGLSGAPSSIEIVNALGMRLLAMTWNAPRGQPDFYARRTQAMFDVRNMLPRVVSAWDGDGNPLDRMEIETLRSVHWDAGTFSRSNNEYHF